MFVHISSKILIIFNKKEAFEEKIEELRCPIELKTIEVYLQILKPAYHLNIQFQSHTSTIAEVLPGLRHLP